MLNQFEATGDQFIVARNGNALVASKSEAGAWHSVRNGQCDCKGFMYRGRCRHLGAVVTATTQPAPTINATFAHYAQTLAGGFTGRQQREEWDTATINAGEAVGFAERRAS